MAELRKTSTENKHWHIAVLRDDGVSGFTSADAEDSHTHELIYSEGAEAQRDPLTGAVLTEAVAPGWYVVEAGEKPHSHELDSESFAEDGEKDAEKQPTRKVVKEFWIEFEAVKAQEKKNHEAAHRAGELYSGKHWTEDQITKLNAANKAAVTVNETESKIDALVGYQRQNRSDIKFLPMENGDNTVSDILTIYWKNQAENMNFHREESKVFLDESVMGRGLWHGVVDFTKNIEGDIVFEKFRNLDAFIGSHEKEDLEDCDLLFLRQWISRSKLDSMYPDLEGKQLGEKSRFDDVPATTESSEDLDSRPTKADELIPSLLRMVEVVERWKKEYYRVDVLALPDEGIYIGARGLSKNERERLKNFPGALVVPRTLFRMRQTICSGNTLLNKGEEYPADSGFFLNEFNLIPVYAKKMDDQWWGKVKGIKDLQLLTNKSFSLFVDICNKMANYGWFYDHETFHSEKDRKDFEVKGTSAGFMQKIRNIAKRPEKVEGTRIPGELIQLMLMLNTKIREILNINLEQLGLDSGAQSGVALRQKIAQQLLGNDFLFDSLAMAKKTIGRMWVRLVQLTQNPDRILKVIGQQAAKEPVEIAGSEMNFQQLQPQMGSLRDKLQAELFDNPLVLTQDVIVSESPASPSAMISGYMALLEAAQAGIPVTMDMILNFAPIPNKAKVMQSIQAQAQAAQQADDKKYQTEIQKTQIAHQPSASARPN